MKTDPSDLDQREVKAFIEQLESLASRYEGLLGDMRQPVEQRAPHAVEELLHQLGDEAPVDDFEAGRRRDRRRVHRDTSSHS